jgi:hypothetical protein
MNIIKDYNKRKKNECLHCNKKSNPYNGLCEDCYMELYRSTIIVRNKNTDRGLEIYKLIRGLLDMSS